jgi:hypothetical protein
LGEIQNGGYGRTKFNIEPCGENVSKRFFSETTWITETKLPRNDHWKVLYKIYVFYANRKSKMATTAGHRLTGTKNLKFVEDHPMNIHDSLALIIFVVSEKKAFEHFPIGSNVNLYPAVVAILDFQLA